MIRLIRRFFRQQDGSVTLDWIVLTAGAIALALGAASMFLGGGEKHSNSMATTISVRPAEH